MTTTITPLATYRTDDPYPFCPGCGHGPVLDALNEALVDLQLDPAQVVIVSDIGCSGLSDQYFTTSAFHGLHGRSLTYASGIKLANPDLQVIVIMGDGGAGIGGAHLLSIARRNIGVTLIVMNNLNFGMTGGQHSVTTPEGVITSTTRHGNLEHPLDICATAGVNGAAYVYRGSSFDKDLPERMAEAMQTPGFALLDVWDLCTAYFVPNNKFGKRSLAKTQEALGMETGVLYRRDVAEFSHAYRQAYAALRDKPALHVPEIETRFDSPLDHPYRLTVAGSAGGKVRSAVRLVGLAAISSGLYAAQRDDFPITVMSGHSVSELIVGPDPIEYPGVLRPDALVILTDDGYAKAKRFLPRMSETDRVVVLPAYADVDTAAHVEVVDPSLLEERVGKAALALVVSVAALAPTGILSRVALEAAAAARPAFADQNLKAVDQGYRLAELRSSR